MSNISFTGGDAADEEGSFSFSREELSSLSSLPINSLRKLASRRSISASGKKVDIVARLVEWDKSQFAEHEDEGEEEEEEASGQTVIASPGGEEKKRSPSTIWIEPEEQGNCWNDVNSPLPTVSGLLSPGQKMRATPTSTSSPSLPSAPAILAKLLSPAKSSPISNPVPSSSSKPRPEPASSPALSPIVSELPVRSLPGSPLVKPAARMLQEYQSPLTPSRSPYRSRAQTLSLLDPNSGEVPLSRKKLQMMLGALRQRLEGLCDSANRVGGTEDDNHTSSNGKSSHLGAALARTARSLGVDERLRLIVRPTPSTAVVKMAAAVEIMAASAAGPAIPQAEASLSSSPVPRPEPSVAALLASRAAPTHVQRSPVRSPLKSPMKPGSQAKVSAPPRLAKTPAPTTAVAAANIAAPAVVITAPSSSSNPVTTAATTLSSSTPAQRRPLSAPRGAIQPATPTQQPKEREATKPGASRSATKTPGSAARPSPRSTVKPAAAAATGAGPSAAASNAAARRALIEASRQARLATAAAATAPATASTKTSASSTSATASTAATNAASRKALIEASRQARLKSSAPSSNSTAPTTTVERPRSVATTTPSRPRPGVGAVPVTPSSAAVCATTAKRGASQQTPSRSAAATPGRAGSAKKGQQSAAKLVGSLGSTAGSISSGVSAASSNKVTGTMAPPVGTIATKRVNTSVNSVGSAGSVSSTASTVSARHTPSRPMAAVTTHAAPAAPALNPFAFAELK